MSAIFGIHHLNKEHVSDEHIHRLIESLQKYPADKVDIWRHKDIFLGCHAQWVTPESIGEQLPFYDDERQLAITADAMIDNREELFDRLGVDHEERKLMPDSQLILLAYSKWGDEVPKQLIGDFAFMIWDGKNHKLFGARDFSGTRPLYYSDHAQRFAFCTVMEPLLQLPYIKKQLNKEWLAEYLAIPNMIDAVDVSKTVIKDIQQVPPSHTITVINGTVKLSKYHVLSLDKKIRLKNDNEYIEGFREVFQKSVDSRLRTFKAVGSQLSGGLDSGSVVSFAAKTLKKQNKKLHTYSSIPMKDFNDWTPRHHVPDERSFVRETVDYVGNIKERYLSLDNKNSYTDIDEWLEMIEMPYKYFENSFWIKGIFKQASKENIGILLSGARGNFTISWGPALEYYVHLIKRMKWIRFTRELKSYSRNIGVGRSKILPVISKKLFPFLSREEEYQFPMLINPDFAKEMNVFDNIQKYGIGVDKSPTYSISEERKYFIDNEFIWNTNGVSLAKLSLQYGMLIRDPTNDIRVINYCMALPLAQFINNGMSRALIRRATEGYLPDKVRLNQTNYGVQGADWVHRMMPYWSDLIEEAKQLLEDKDVAQYLNMETIRNALSKAMEVVPKGDYSPNPYLRILMRSIIVYRFLHSFNAKGGDTYEKSMARAKIAIVGY